MKLWFRKPQSMLEEARHAFQKTSLMTEVTVNVKKTTTKDNNKNNNKKLHSSDVTGSFKNRRSRSVTVLKCDRASHWRGMRAALTTLRRSTETKYRVNDAANSRPPRAADLFFL